MLFANGVTVRYGGLTAVDHVNLHVLPKTIHAVIGPNGAGKSTLFNAISGFAPIASGDIRFEEKTITGFPSHKIAAAGIGRTFQNIKLFSELSVLENVLVGYHMSVKSTLFQDMFHTKGHRKSEHEIREEAHDILQRVNLLHRKDKPAGSLPYGEQRKLEIVRAMACHPRLLMLDEPAAGMNPAETNMLKDLISQICSEGLTILLIEHDVKMVMSLAHTITVLDHGCEICCGNAVTVRNDPKVIKAYLGKSQGGHTNEK